MSNRPQPDPSPAPTGAAPSTGAAPDAVDAGPVPCQLHGADPITLAIAKAMAVEGEENGCFDRVAEYETITDPTERADFDRAHGCPFDDYEDCDRWLRKAAAALAADPLRACLADRHRLAAALYTARHPNGWRWANLTAGEQAEFLAQADVVAAALQAVGAPA